MDPLRDSAIVEAPHEPVAVGRVGHPSDGRAASETGGKPVQQSENSSPAARAPGKVSASHE